MVKYTVIIFLFILFSCKTTNTEFSKRRIIHLDASINAININDILTDEAYNKSCVIIFENKQNPIQKFDSILKSSRENLITKIQKDSISGKNYILISRKK